MSKVNPLRSLFLGVAKELSPGEVKTLKLLLKGEPIPVYQIVEMQTAGEIFIKLEEMGLVSGTDLTLLKDLLESLQRRPLVDMVEKFEAERRESCAGVRDPRLYGQSKEPLSMPTNSMIIKDDNSRRSTMTAAGGMFAEATLTGCNVDINITSSSAGADNETN